MKKLFGYLVVAAIVLAVISFFVAPAVAFFGIRSAAGARDVAGLQQLIDFDAVRASLRSQLVDRPQALTPVPSFIKDPIGAVRRKFEETVAPRGPDPDAYLTPAALDALTRGQGRVADVLTSGAREPAAPWPRPIYWGVNRARLAVGNKGPGRTVFTFERRGPYDWKLVHIGLSPDQNIATVEP